RATPGSPPVRLAAPAPTPPPSEPPPSRRIGPFSLGERVTDDWSIESLGPTEGGFTVTLLGPAGRARFEVNCADVEHRSPFDIGAAHIFYSSDVPFPIVQPLGSVLRDRVRSAVAAQDPCQAVNDWTQATR